MTSIDEQSPDIAQGVDVGGAGDSGLVFGYACDETPDPMAMAINLPHRTPRRLSEARRARTLSYLRPDGKVQVTLGYDESGRPVTVEHVVLAAQHPAEVDVAELRFD